MLSINMRIFKTVLLIASFGTSVRCLPVTEESPKAEVSSSVIPQETTTAASISDTTDYYDQRQNGTENYRIHVDGVVFVFAPVEALLLMAGGTDSNLPISNHSEFFDSRSALRLTNLLAPLIHRIHHERGINVH